MAAAAAAAHISVALEDLGKQLLKDDDGDFAASIYGNKPWRPWQYAFIPPVIYGIHQINEDWSFLGMLCESIHQCMWMDAERGSLLKLLALKIEAVADKIAQDVEDKKQLMKNQCRESEFLELVSYYETETRRLMVEIRKDVEDLSARCSFQVHSPPLPLSRPPPGESIFTFWTSFVDSVLSNLEFIKWSTVDSNVDSSCTIGTQSYALYKEVKLIRDYVVGVCSSGIDFQAVAGGDDDDAIIIDEFVNHVASVIVKTAIRSFSFWFRYKTTTTMEPPIEYCKETGLAELVVEDLLHEIDPINPKFMDLHLHFLMGLYNIGRYQGGNFVHHFCKYFFKSREGDYRNELSSLLTCFINNMLHKEEEKDVVQSFCQEINAVLLWMASLFEAVRKEELELKEEVLWMTSLFEPVCKEEEKQQEEQEEEKQEEEQDEEKEEEEEEEQDEEKEAEEQEEQEEEKVQKEQEEVLWMTSLFETIRKEEVKEEVYLPPCSALFIEICLLKAEVSLKKIHHNYFLSSNTSFMISAEKNQNEDEFKQILENMRRYSEYLPYEKMEHGKKSLEVIEQVHLQVASLCQSFESKKISKSTLKNSILRLLLEIVFFRVESFLGELLLIKSDCAEISFLADGKHHTELLLEQLNFLKPILSSKQVTEREDTHIIFAQIEAILRGMTRLCCSNRSSKKITQDMINKMILPTSELLDELKYLKSVLIKNGPQVPLSKFPETRKLGFIDFVCTNLGELLKYNPSSKFAPQKHYIEEIQLHFKSLSSFLIKVSDLDMRAHPELKDLGNRVANVAYKMEYVIDSIEDEDEDQWQHFSWFYNLLEELRLLNLHASGFHLTASDARVQNVNDVTQVSFDIIPRDGMQEAINEMVIDFGEEVQVIIDQLTKGSSRRVIVSFVGMAGIGKTTLARKVYNNQNIMCHFHRCAWCYVSQLYEKRDLLLGILRDIHGLTDEIRQMSSEDLESKLRQCLLKNKYLIVLDDVWDANAWNDLKNSFPDDVNGSRILITSRLRDVALEIEPNGNPHSLRPLSDDESWNLLERKVFQGEACPQELLLAGKEIARKCEGLPLAVVAISGLLQKTEKNKELWEKISDTLSSEIMKDREARCMEILELSYKHLPEYLKACFLYLGVFLDDRDIPVSKMLRLWLAEGFIEKTESKSLDDTAEAYLEDLINRSLVIISKRRSNGKVKACHLHDLILDFCRSKAKEENFLQLVTKCDQPYASFPSSDYGFEFDFYHHSEPVAYKAYRLSILLKRNHFVESRPSGLSTRSLLFFASADSEPRCPYDISFVCHNFKLLRILDFECINIGVSFPGQINLLNLLRYLAVNGYMHYIPKSIANLSQLETLVVKGLRGKVVLPRTIWCMTKLRHLHVNIHVAFDLDAEEELEDESEFDTHDEEFGDESKILDFDELKNLVSFSCPSLSCDEDTEKIMKRLPNLRKLKCIFFESRNSPENCGQFPRLNFLTHLESLNIFFYGTPLNTSEFSFPLNLKELTLSSFQLPWNRISAIGRLPNLAVLKLLSGAFEGQSWDMKEEEFKELKFLKLEKLNISQWNASCDHLPKLKRLVIQNCKDLEKIPCDFADITTLEMIEVHWCGQSAEESAKEIGEATGEIKVLISSSHLRS